MTLDDLPANAPPIHPSSSRDIEILRAIFVDSIAYDKIIHPEVIGQALVSGLTDWIDNRPGAARRLIATIVELERCGALTSEKKAFFIHQIGIYENTRALS
ncbi:hypothetical protein I8746_10265 [Pseudomonas sp. USTB-Z]|uniref:hypothetical protein n=1 Tax=Pseudomonas sp. USTB-Z TaxID=2794351 RepID=UPI001C829D01|nr:hypothetical protein [Pseudomonas sp. USTB-Z]MBX6689986.1 hypothetical protein [Pseudomonas sp. USTB-Z]